MRREAIVRVDAVERALAQSPAIITTTGDRDELYILTREMSHPEDGAWRLTNFLHDGPWGHDTRPTIRELAELVANRRPASIRPATDDDVIAWTSTPAFVTGAKHVAFIQAINALSYARSRGSDADYQAMRDLELRAHQLYATDPDAAIALVQSGLPQQNPLTGTVGTLTQNPAWVTQSMASHYESLEERVPPKWMPLLSSVRAQRGRLSARLREYGCGAYGCVYPTLDDHVVLKVTTDPTEAEFATDISQQLSVPIVVAYKLAMRLDAQHERRDIFLLWRESATQVGELGEHPAVAEQHAAAQASYEVLRHGPHRNRYAIKLPRREIQAWMAAVHDMSKDLRLRYLADGMLKVYREQGIFFGDVHSGNLGVVIRDGKPTWVITDPGHVSVTGHR